MSGLGTKLGPCGLSQLSSLLMVFVLAWFERESYYVALAGLEHTL